MSLIPCPGRTADICAHISGGVEAQCKICGEPESLNILNEFNRCYQEKILEIEGNNNDALQRKLEVQNKWIEALTDQTRMMANVIQDLEVAATERVQMLEDKLQNSAKNIGEVMQKYKSFDFTLNSSGQPLQKVQHLESDLRTLMELIRRARADGDWNTDGLHFYEVSTKQIFDEDPPNYTTNENCANQNNSGKVHALPKKYSNSLVSTTGVNCLCEKDSKVDDKSVNNRTNNLLQTQKDCCRSTAHHIDVITKDLHRKTQEYEQLKNTMVDMRDALIEEVASKHDTILALKKDIHDLEERCIQADKQTAFKDDIIKQLRKDLKQLKHQNISNPDLISLHVEKLQRDIDNLQNENHKLKAMCECGKNNPDKENNISRQMESKLEQTLRQKDEELNEILERKSEEVEYLKCKCKELEDALSNSNEKAANFQKAIDLYINSINILEQNDEKVTNEIYVQKSAILHLQQALVTSKSEIDNLRQERQRSEQQHLIQLKEMYDQKTSLENKTHFLEMQLTHLSCSYNKLQNVFVDLEVQHFNSVQDMSMSEALLLKYQKQLKQYEEQKTNFKNDINKLHQEKWCQDEIIKSSREEMSELATQLSDLHGILNLPNTCNDDCEIVAQSIATINELNRIIEEKSAEILQNSTTLQKIKNNLDAARVENQKLKNTNVQMTTTISQLQSKIKHHDDESKELAKCRCEIVEYKKRAAEMKSNMDGKTNEHERLKNDFCGQRDILLATQKEIITIREQQLQTTKQNQKKIDDLKNKLNQNQEHLKKAESEEEKCKCTITKIKETLTEINNDQLDSDFLDGNLKQKSFKITCKSQNSDNCLNCTCELDFLKEILSNLQLTLQNHSDKLASYEELNQNLQTDLNHYQSVVADNEKQCCERETSHTKQIDELTEQLQCSQMEEERLTNMCKCQKQELDNLSEKMRKLSLQKQQVATAELAMKKLQNDIQETVTSQMALNAENTQLKAKVSKLAELEVRNGDVRNQLEKNQLELRSLRKVNGNLVYQNQALMQELQCLHKCYDNLQNQHRYICAWTQELELELIEVRLCREELYLGTKEVVDNVRCWLGEQEQINDEVDQRDKKYSSTINRLKDQLENFLKRKVNPKKPQHCCTTIPNAIVEYRTNRPWGSIDSHGTDSLERNSSTCSNASIEDIYNPKGQENGESSACDVIKKVEYMTAQIRESNEAWKNQITKSNTNNSNKNNANENLWCPKRK